MKMIAKAKSNVARWSSLDEPLVPRADGLYRDSNPFLSSGWNIKRPVKTGKLPRNVWYCASELSIFRPGIHPSDRYLSYLGYRGSEAADLLERLDEGITIRRLRGNTQAGGEALLTF